MSAHDTSVTGRFGPYGGRYVPETLMHALEELAAVYDAARADPRFWSELDDLLRNYVGRPTPITAVPRLSAQVGAKVILKREDLNHTGAHKINNTLGQVLLAQRMKKRRIIAETGAGQHGVATATVCARFGLECIVYMGEADMRRQRLNVYRMELMGAKVVPVTSGTRTLKDATNEALRDWVTNVTTTHYIIGSVVGPDPFPRLVRDFQSVIGREARAQVLEQLGRLHRCRGVRGRRLERDGNLYRVPRGLRRAARGRGSGRRGGRQSSARGDAGRRTAGRVPRESELFVAGRRRAGPARS